MSAWSLKLSYYVMKKWDAVEGFWGSNDSVEYLKCLSFLLQSWDSVFLWLVPVVNPWSYPHLHIAQIFPILASAHPSSKSCVSIMINVIVYDMILPKDNFKKEKIVFYFTIYFLQWECWFYVLYGYRSFPFLRKHWMW